jgi:hypothetical protein
MKAFHGDENIKKIYLERVMAHQKADEIEKGYYWENGKGCAVGCTIHSSDDSKYEMELGIPVWLAKLEDRLFEKMSNESSKKWPFSFLEAINTGSDLEKVKAPFLIFVLESALEKFDHKRYPGCKKVIQDVIDLYKSGETDLNKFREAKSVAAAADASASAAFAAFAASAAADASAAFAACHAASASDAAFAAAFAASAADAASDAADAAGPGARENELEKFANKLLELLKETK